MYVVVLILRGLPVVVGGTGGAPVGRVGRRRREIDVTGSRGGAVRPMAANQTWPPRAIAPRARPCVCACANTYDDGDGAADIRFSSVVRAVRGCVPSRAIDAYDSRPHAHTPPHCCRATITPRHRIPRRRLLRRARNGVPPVYIKPIFFCLVITLGAVSFDLNFFSVQIFFSSRSLGTYNTRVRFKGAVVKY